MSYSFITVSGIRLVSSDGSTADTNLPGSGGDAIFDNFHYIAYNLANPQVVTVVGISNRTLLNSSSQVVFDWNTVSFFNPSNGTLTAEMDSRALYDLNEIPSLGWGSRSLVDTNSEAVLDWQNYQILKSNVEIINWSTCSINDTGGFQSIKWGNDRKLYYYNPTEEITYAVFDWGGNAPKPRILGSHPTMPASGMFYYNHVSGAIMVYNGTTWKQLATVN